MKRKIYKKGDKVQSKFRGVFWYGVVMGIEESKNDVRHIVVVVPMLDRSGNPQRKRYLKRLHPSWLIPACFEDRFIKKHWLQ